MNTDSIYQITKRKEVKPNEKNPNDNIQRFGHGTKTRLGNLSPVANPTARFGKSKKGESQR